MVLWLNKISAVFLPLTLTWTLHNKLINIINQERTIIIMQLNHLNHAKSSSTFSNFKLINGCTDTNHIINLPSKKHIFSLCHLPLPCFFPPIVPCLQWTMECCLLECYHCYQAGEQWAGRCNVHHLILSTVFWLNPILISVMIELKGCHLI